MGWRLSSDALAGPLQVSDDEYTKLLHDGIQPVAAIDSNFASFTYTPRSLPEDDTSMVSRLTPPDCGGRTARDGS